MKELPSVAYLRECLVYDPETGILTWRDRPRGHFPDDGSWRRFLANFAGKPAGSASDRYIRVIISPHKLYAHRIIWTMQTGAWPGVEIDHENGDKLDNRWGNLREATHQGNMRNRPGWGGRDLPKGVSRHRSGNRYTAHCWKDGRNLYLGCFATPEAAHEAYRAVAAELHGGFFNAGEHRNVRCQEPLC